MAGTQSPHECSTCAVAKEGTTRAAYNFACPDCCARYVLDGINKFGDSQHVENIKDRLFERLGERA